ncbi:MAG: NUDIX domain-containing protein [Roseburia sp.]
MKILAVFDAGDYQNTVAVYEKYSVRAIIIRDGKLAMQCSRDGEYKIPGGGVEPGEDDVQAIWREVREETGLHVLSETTVALGEIVERRRDIFDSAKKYVCHSRFYYCEVDAAQEALSLTPSEVARGYELKWATPQEICARNMQNKSDPWIIRDTTFVKMVMDGDVVLPALTFHVAK